MQILIRADLFCHSGRHVGRPEWFQRAYGGPSAVEVAMERQMSSQLVEWVSLGQEREREREGETRVGSPHNMNAARGVPL